MGYVGTDVGDDQHLINPIGAMQDPATGEINADMTIYHAKKGAEAPEH